MKTHYKKCSKTTTVKAMDPMMRQYSLRALPISIVFLVALIGISTLLGTVIALPQLMQTHSANARAMSQVITETNHIHLPILIHDGEAASPTRVDTDTTATPAATITPQPSSTPQPTSDVAWDPRLDQRGAVLVPATPTSGQGYWRLIRGRWFNEAESEGRVHIFVDTLDENGARQTGVPLLVSWADGDTTIVTEAKPGEPAANFAMFTWAPAYDIRPIDGHPADRVNGLGLGSIEQPRFNIHTSYEFTWQWTIFEEATPTPTVTLIPTTILTPTLSATPVITNTPEISTTPTATSTQAISLTATSQPTPIPTSTATATSTPSSTPSNTATMTPSPTSSAIATETPTPVFDTEFSFSRGELVACTSNQNQTLVNGTVFIDNVPAPGYRVIFDFETTGDGVTPPQITRENPAGFYEHILGEGNWLVWIVDEDGTRISVQVPFTIDSAGDDFEESCRVATVNFYG